MVCESPGIHFFRLVSEVNTSQGTLTWHLRQLEKAKLLISAKYGGKRIFYPYLLSTIENAKAFAALRCETAQQVFREINKNPGINQRQISVALGVHYETVRYHLNRFEKVGLIVRYRDGREMRGFLGELGERIVEGNHNHQNGAEKFVNYLLRKLEEGCLTPIEVFHSDKEVSFRVKGPGDEQFDLTIKLNGWSFLSN